MKKKLSLTNLCMNLVQSYAIFRPIANFLAFISPTCSDKHPHRRQIKQTPSKLVLSKRLFYFFLKIFLCFRIISYLCTLNLKP